MWQLLSKTQRGIVRSSCLVFASKFIKNLPVEYTEQHLPTLAPMIFEMVQDDSTVVQSCLWRDGYYTLGDKFPQVWSLVSLKKGFIPGAMTCLKNSGFGAASSLYQNLIKFVSVFPVFHLHNFKDDKANKFTVKDRANFLTQFYQSLYAGRKNDEAANTHHELTGAYFESLTFYLLKRFTPFAEAKAFDFGDDELSHAWNQVKQVIEMPGKDFIKNYTKKASKVLN